MREGATALLPMFGLRDECERYVGCRVVILVCALARREIKIELTEGGECEVSLGGRVGG